MKATAAQLKKMCGLELVDYGKEGQGIILPKGMKIDRSGNVTEGRIAIVLKP
jgi:hypothetical protein